MGVGGPLLRFGGVGLRIVQCLSCIIILAIYSYYLSILSNHDLNISNQIRATEGISGSGVLYTVFGVILTLCLGGVAFFGFLAVILDVLFAGAFIAVAWMTRHGANSCTGIVRTPLGNGEANADSPGYGANGFGFGDGETATYFPNLHLACRLNTACFAISIILVFLFIITAVWSVMMVRHHKKEKKYGPSPANGYTSGSGRRPFWKRNRATHPPKDAEAATALGTNRHSHETGTTIGNNGAYSGGFTEPKHGHF